MLREMARRIVDDEERGTYAEYNPIHYCPVDRAGHLTMVIEKYNDENGSTVRVPGLNPITLGGYHSSYFNCNGGVIFTRENLLNIIKAMGENDRLIIASPDKLNAEKFKEEADEAKSILIYEYDSFIGVDAVNSKQKEFRMKHVRIAEEALEEFLKLEESPDATVGFKEYPRGEIRFYIEEPGLHVYSKKIGDKVLTGSHDMIRTLIERGYNKLERIEPSFVLAVEDVKKEYAFSDSVHSKKK